MQVGSPSPALDGKPPEQCKARDIAQSVLIDRSTARITSGQRISLSNVENVSEEQKGDYSYIYYEALSQARPSLSGLLYHPQICSGFCSCCACMCMVRLFDHVHIWDDLDGSQLAPPLRSNCTRGSSQAALHLTGLHKGWLAGRSQHIQPSGERELQAQQSGDQLAQRHEGSQIDILLHADINMPGGAMGGVEGRVLSSNEIFHNAQS